MAIGNSIGRLTPMINVGGKLQSEISLLKMNRELQIIIQRIQEDLNNLQSQVSLIST